MKTAKPQPHKRGARVLGHIHTAADGTLFYLHRRRLADAHCRGEKNLSAAVRADKAAWAVDEYTIHQMKAKGCTRLGVEVRETGEWFLAEIADWTDPTISFANYRTSGGERCLPFSRFARALH